MMKTHGGSMRYTIARKNKFNIKKNVNYLIEKEKIKKLNKIDTCIRLKKKLLSIRKNLEKKIDNLKKKGSKYVGMLHLLKALQYQFL